MITKRSHKKVVRDSTGDTRPSYHSGMDYWKMTRVALEIANKEFARKMNGEKFEDDGRTR